MDCAKFESPIDREGRAVVDETPAGSGDRRQRLGIEGERLAERYLVGQGMRVLARRFRWRRTEIDLIVWDDRTLVFVEVKTRSGVRAGHPAEAVTALKRERIARTAAAFLQRHFPVQPSCRFDVVGILRIDGEAAEIRHFRDAFRLTGTG